MILLTIMDILWVVEWEDVQQVYTGKCMRFNYLLGHQSTRLLGLDIATLSIKLLELSLNNSTYKVESFGIIPLPLKAIEENRIVDASAVIKTIEDLIHIAKPSVKTTATAVSGAASMSKIIQLDANLTESEMEEQIILQEIPRILPFSVEEASIDFEILRKNNAQPNLNDVLVTASRTENVIERVKVIEDAGLNVKVVDVESYVMERACQLICDQLLEGGKNKTIAVVDIGSFLTKTTVLHNNETIYHREELFGSYQLTETIQNHYGISFSEAGLAKKRGNLGEEYELNVLEPFKQMLIPLVRRSLQFFFSAQHIDHIDHILLAGGGALTKGLADLLSEQIGVPVSIANPFLNMDIASNVDTERLYANAPMMMIACGLALRSFVHGKH